MKYYISTASGQSIFMSPRDYKEYGMQSIVYEWASTQPLSAISAMSYMGIQADGEGVLHKYHVKCIAEVTARLVEERPKEEKSNE